MLRAITAISSPDPGTTGAGSGMNRLCRRRACRALIGAAAGLVLVIAATAVAGWSVASPPRAGPPLVQSGARVVGSARAGAGVSGSAVGASTTTSSRSGEVGRLPAPPFSATLSGTIAEAGPDRSGQVQITIHALASGGAAAQLLVVLRGEPDGGGLAMRSSEVTFGPASDPGEFEGRVVVLNGEELVAVVRSAQGSSLDLGADLRIDPSSAALEGGLHVTSARAIPSAGADEDGGR